MRTWWNGRHNRLKICWALCPCGFESRLPHHQKPRFRGFFLFFYVVRRPFPFAFKNVSGHQWGTAISVSFLPTNEIIILKSNTFFKPQSLSIINSFRRTFFILILTDCFGLSRAVGLDDAAGRRRLYRRKNQHACRLSSWARSYDAANPTWTNGLMKTYRQTGRNNPALFFISCIIYNLLQF